MFKKLLKITVASICFLLINCASIPDKAVDGNLSGNLKADYYATNEDGKTQAIRLKKDIGLINYLEEQGMDIELVWIGPGSMAVCGRVNDEAGDRCELFYFDDVRLQFQEDWRVHAPRGVELLNYDAVIEALKKAIMNSAS
jgi:hypothetical protein